MTYKVTSRFPNDFKDQDIASFKFEEDARFFIEKKLIANASDTMNPNQIIYKLYEFDDLLEEFDPRKTVLPASKASTSVGDAQGQATSSSGFRPSPFNTAPTPAGTAKKWLKDDEDEEQNK